MKKEKTKSNPNSDLRRQAEEHLKSCEGNQASSVEEKSKDYQALVHELQVHQIELETQNEELKRARLEADEALIKYSDLYDFAPIGLFTLNDQKQILEVNLMGAELLGMGRRSLKHRLFGQFVATADLPVFYDFLKKAFDTHVKQSCELKLIRFEGPEVYARVEGRVSEDDDRPTSLRECRIAVIDITERKIAEEETRQAHDYLSHILESIGYAFYAIDSEWRFRYVNKQATRITGKPQEMLLGKTI